MTIDDAIRAVYDNFDPIAADSIVNDPTVAAIFTEQVNRHLSGQHADIKTVNGRLIALRKRGQDNGGLPRRSRSYRGRNTTNS